MKFGCELNHILTHLLQMTFGKETRPQVTRPLHHSRNQLEHDVALQQIGQHTANGGR